MATLVTLPYTKLTQINSHRSKRVFQNLFSNESQNKYIFVVSLILAISVALSTVLLCAEVSQLNDDMFGHVTILDEPELLNALRDAQAKGVIMGIHGWEHENYSNMDPNHAKELVEKGKLVFKEGGLAPRVFISPFEIYGVPTNPSVRKAINSTGVATSLPPLKTSNSNYDIDEFTWNWRTMQSFNDPRFKKSTEMIKEEKPQTIVLHAMDWNHYVNQFLINYLSSTDQTNITVRMDDVEVNTPKEVVNGMAQLTQYKSVGRVVLAVIPSGVSKGGDPNIRGIKVDSILRMYYWFFIITALFPTVLFFIWKWLSYLNSKRTQHKYRLQDKQNAEYPGLVSIIVPAYNEEKTIGKCLDSILNQDYKGKTEVIVVNDGSNDHTAEIVSKYPVKFIDLKVNKGKANALNKAIEDAKGDILVFTDSDSYMSASAVSSLVRCLNENRDAQMVAGDVFIHDTHGKKWVMKYFQMIEYFLEQEIPRYLQSLNGRVLVCPGPLTAARRKVCDTIKFSDKTIVEDAEFTVRALKNSMKIIREPNAKVYTNAPETFGVWYKQRKRWWYGNLQVWRLHKKWAMRNAWMLFNYSGYIFGICTIILFALLPYLLLQYDNLMRISLRGLLFMVVFLILYTVAIASFFTKNKKLLPMLLPYVLIYSTIKVVIISYLYLCYITGRGLKVRFGSRTMKVR